MNLLLFLAALLWAHDGPPGHTHVAEPSIKIDLRLGMPEAMEAALSVHDGKFRILAITQMVEAIGKEYPFTTRQTPSAVIGDFNGDETPDLALLGWSDGAMRLLMLMSKPGGYGVQEAGKWNRAFPDGTVTREHLFLLRKGKDGRKVDAVKFADGKSSQIVVFTAGKPVLKPL